MNAIGILTALSLVFLSGTGMSGGNRQVRTVLRTEIGEQTVIKADSLLDAPPVTVTSFYCERSEGGIHDFYSEGDYWWPDPKNPDGPYIRRDGESNPDNFSAHRHAMIRLSDIVASLTSAYLLTGDDRYALSVEKHIRAWFIDPETRMNPSLIYAQAIKGVVSGRGIGIIDTIHLSEVAQSLIRLEGVISDEVLEGAKRWFAAYLEWMRVHPYGRKEMNATNNHGTCWAVQAAVFAKFTGNTTVMDFCRERFRNVFIPGQMDAEGGFPQELARTKSFGYSLFNLDAMAALCQILSTPEDNLWTFRTEDGRGISKGVEFILPYIADKNRWKYGRDVAHWDEWPVAHPTLVFYWAQTGDMRCLRQWKKLEHFPKGEEVIRNLPLRNPIIWLYF